MNILYAGLAFAGCSTSLGHLGQLAVPPIPPRRARGSLFADAPYAIGWRHRGRVVRVTLMQAYFARLHVARLRDVLDPGTDVDSLARGVGADARGWRELARFLPRVDGVVFVADSRPDRAAIGYALDSRARDLVDAGCDIHTIPLVVQLNKRDLADAIAIDKVRASLFWPGSLVAVVESIATRGKGVREALDALVDVL